MIVRILGEGQLDVDDSAADELDELDSRLEAAVEQDDDAAFQVALTALLDRVRSIGTSVDADVIKPSALILPYDGATMDEVRKLLADDGLISG